MHGNQDHFDKWRNRQDVVIVKRALKVEGHSLSESEAKEKEKPVKLEDGA